jgi:subfamily B ATP-binding cassette protein MsbA
VRVVKGYHAEEREHQVFTEGVHRLLQNVFRTLTATSVMSLSSATLMGVVGAIVMLMGTRQIIAGQLTLGGFFTYTMFLGYLAAPLFQVVSIGTQITEAIAGLERTREVLSEKPEDDDPRQTVDVTGEFCTSGKERDTGTRGAGKWPGENTRRSRSSGFCVRLRWL